MCKLLLGAATADTGVSLSVDWRKGRREIVNRNFLKLFIRTFSSGSVDWKKEDPLKNVECQCKT